MTVDKKKSMPVSDEPWCVFYAEGLSAGYKGRPVVCGVDIELHAGEIICIIGPNGAGKSTLLNTITGRIRPVSGDLILCGKSLRDMKEKDIARHMSLVLTDRVDAELMTCRDVVASGRSPYTGPLGILGKKDKLMIEDALVSMNASEIAEEQISEVSDGQRQRIMLARAICQDTEMLVLDEPTSYLDIRYRLEIMTTLKKLAKEKAKAVIMSVHEIELAKAVADYVICIRDGSVFAEGRPEEVFTSQSINALFDLDPDQYDECLRKVIDNTVL